MFGYQAINHGFESQLCYQPGGMPWTSHVNAPWLRTEDFSLVILSIIIVLPHTIAVSMKGLTHGTYQREDDSWNRVYTKQVLAITLTINILSILRIANLKLGEAN